MPDDKLRGIVTRMVEAGESEADIAAVIQRYGETAPKPEGKSVGGFIGNAIASTGKLLKDTAVGAGSALIEASPIGLARTIQDPTRGLRMMKALPGAVAEHVSSKYGSLDKVGDTLYNDPASVAADASVLLSGGAAAAARAPRLAGVLRKAGAATNPLQVTKPIATGAEIGAAAAIRPLLAPPTALVRQQRGPLEIERAALRSGAVTERGAGKKLKAATAETDRAAAAATARGAQIPREKIAQFPKTLDEVEGVTPNVKELDELAALESDTIASLPPKMTPTELLGKRRSQDRAVDKAYRAEEKGGYIRGVKDKGQKEIAGNMRQQFREAVPEAAASDDKARKMGLVRGALENANTRPKSIPMTAALAGLGGGAVAGGPIGALIGSVAGVGRLAPQVPLALASPPVRALAAAATPQAQQGLLLAALLERLTGDR